MHQVRTLLNTEMIYVHSESLLSELIKMPLKNHFLENIRYLIYYSLLHLKLTMVGKLRIINSLIPP